MDISFEKVSYTYQLNTPFEYQALKDISFHIPSGSFTAIAGHTGSGKSTLIQHLNGLLLPTAGEVNLGNFKLHAGKKPKDLKALRKKTGIVFQYPEHQLFEETVAKDIAFGPRNFGVGEEEIEARIREALQAVGLPEGLLDRSPFDLSGGQMRRAAIAGVLAVKPELLVLDEPTAGLDPRGQKNIMDMFSKLHQEKAMTTILVTHSMEDVLTYADHVLILDHGEKYMEGKPAEVLRKKAALNHVQLDVPEMIEFLYKAEEKLGLPFSYHGQSVPELAAELKQAVRGMAADE